MKTTDYQTFLESKREKVAPVGFRVDEREICSSLFDWQRRIVQWARHVAAHSGRAVLILAPLAVSDQTIREGAKFGIPVKRCNTAADIDDHGINVTNYERLDKFTPEPFAERLIVAAGHFPVNPAYLSTAFGGRDNFPADPEARRRAEIGSTEATRPPESSAAVAGGELLQG